jgi:hypothetical protein
MKKLIVVLFFLTVTLSFGQVFSEEKDNKIKPDTAYEIDPNGDAIFGLLGLFDSAALAGSAKDQFEQGEIYVPLFGTTAKL